VTYERFGDAETPPVMPIMGGDAQMIHWPERFCAELVEHGPRVIRFDNRDTGRSSHFSEAVRRG
jgi:pimeloyl-ACP methyl ester carboxylesterase